MKVPVDGLMLAIAVLLLLHVPPDVASLNVAVAPRHIDVVPVIWPGSGFTYTVPVTTQPAAVV